MASVERALTKSLLSNLSEESVRLRRQDVLSTPNPIRRAAVLALHNLAVRQPRLVAHMLGLPYAEHGFEYVGSGVDSTVLRVDETEVLKVNRKSADSNASERRQLVDSQQANHAKLVAALGPFVVPHTATRVGQHPVVSSFEIVEIRQPYVEVFDPRFLYPASTEAIAEKISSLEAQAIPVADQLGEYIERSRSLFQHHQLLPDVIGPANLVLVDGTNLQQIDGVPVSSEHPETQAAIGGYLNMMETAIGLAA